MTGEQLYGLYISALEQNNSGGDSWENLGDEEHTQWNTFARAVMPALDSREVSAVLAGLRMAQVGIQGGTSYLDTDNYTQGGEIEGLDPDEIDDLCERLNFGG